MSLRVKGSRVLHSSHRWNDPKTVKLAGNEVCFGSGLQSFHSMEERTPALLPQGCDSEEQVAGQTA